MEKGISNRIPPSVCPTCSYRLDCAGEGLLGLHSQPRPGDISLCAKCGTVLIFDNDLLMIPMEAEKLEDLKSRHPKVFAELIIAQQAIYQMTAKRN